MALNIIVILLFGCSCYLIWAWYRWDLWNIAHDGSWPHGFPFPDRWLVALEEYCNKAIPAPKGIIEMHGEFQKVKYAIAMAASLFLVLGILCVLPAAFHLKRRISANHRGFAMQVK